MTGSASSVPLSDEKLPPAAKQARQDLYPSLPMRCKGLKIKTAGLNYTSTSRPCRRTGRQREICPRRSQQM